MSDRTDTKPTDEEVVRLLKRVRRQMNMALFDNEYHTIVDRVADMLRRYKLNGKA